MKTAAATNSLRANMGRVRQDSAAEKKPISPNFVINASWFAEHGAFQLFIGLQSYGL